MASVNKVIIIGNLGRDPEIRYMPSGDAVANITVATTDKWKDKQSGETREATEWHRISFFGGRAATPEWSPRGDLIAFTHISGNLRIAVMTPKGQEMRYLTDSWQDEAPTWSPNGRVVQFFRTTRDSGHTAIWQVDLTGRNERRLPTPVDASDPAWGPSRP